eukprot:scaffold12782_cov168-Amphora_coffeaeformis.AAC.4
MSRSRLSSCVCVAVVRQTEIVAVWEAKVWYILLTLLLGRTKLSRNGISTDDFCALQQCAVVSREKWPFTRHKTRAFTVSNQPTLALTMASTTIPAECDYLVIGAGATALAFCDSLLEGCRQQQPQSASLPMLVLLDPHERPGGQWNSSYEFVQLHQPSAMYGVESMSLEDESAEDPTKHRATRTEIIAYYERVLEKWRSNLTFVGKTWFDFKSMKEAQGEVRTYKYQQLDESGKIHHEIRVRRKVVDARFLQPDLPIDTPPKFKFDAEKVHCIAVNALTTTTSGSNAHHFVVIGGGKTGMDAVYYLLTKRNVKPSDVVWIMPHDAWITARESIGNCMEFLHTALVQAKEQQSSEKLADYVQTSPDCLQRAFLKWEQEGKVYRLDPTILPPKFKDATLCKEELTTLRTVEQVIRGKGRVTSIAPNGDLHMEDGTKLPLPWKDEAKHTTFVHCSAGCFNYTKQPTQAPPVFTDHVLTIQDVYGTPGFCFVGSIIGKLESLSNLSYAEKNALCVAPSPNTTPPPALGPSGGDIGMLSSSHGFVQRLGNVRKWLNVPELRTWLVGHRLFNLGYFPTAEAMQSMIDETWSIAVQSGLVVDDNKA